MKKKLAIATTAVMPATQTTAAQALDLATLTPEQLLKLQQQLKALKKADSIDLGKWKLIVDKHLHELDDSIDIPAGQPYAFRWTTADILAACQAGGVIKPTLTDAERAEHIKRIQTRKQKLEKVRDDKGNLVHNVGYKPSTNSFGPMTAAKIVEWLSNPANVETVSVDQATQMHALIKHII